MLRSFAVLYLVAIVLLLFSQNASTLRGDCPTLPNSTTLESLIGGTFRGGDSPIITVRKFNSVCLVSGMFTDTFRMLSVVVHEL